ncbi:unnamed protein product [Oppiella nova]|uniref:Homeobox domain-containing protein n=1 Tax=Oppiella nova TaxID=334625 RepID=A0A7R9M3V3_9ACAR|nr:unnamed protein product [Oppiella nova]CAG2169052.1 unnamed protein product [Oppiella nova]
MFQSNKFSSFMIKGMVESVGCSGPTASTIVWQHYLLRQRMLMQAKPRKGGQIRFTSEQSVSLEREFGRQKYLSPIERKSIASDLGLSERQIKTWFQNRRAKWRRCKQLSGDGDEDKHILFNKYKDTHSCSRDNDNDEPYESSCHPYQCQTNSHPNDFNN